MWTRENRGRYDRSRLRYPTDLTDEECVRLGLWALATEHARSALRREKAGAAQIDYVKPERRAIGSELCWNLGDAVIRRRFVLACR